MPNRGTAVKLVIAEMDTRTGEGFSFITSACASKIEEASLEEVCRKTLIDNT